MKKATGKLFLALTNIIVLCSFLFVGVLAAIEPAVKFSVNVKYDQAIMVKAYISTNSIEATEGEGGRDFRHQGLTKPVTGYEGDPGDFNTSFSALFLDTMAPSPDYTDLGKFENLNEGHLEYGTEGIWFYIFIENHNPNKKLMCDISVDFEEGNNQFLSFASIKGIEVDEANETASVKFIMFEIEPNIAEVAGNLESEITINVEFSSGMDVSGE